MDAHQDFWERLQKKYEDKHKILLTREAELRYKLEAMDAIIGDSRKSSPQTAPPVMSTTPSSVPEPKSHPAIEQPLLSFGIPTNDIKSCVCPPPQEKSGGFFKCVMSMLPSLRSKNAPPSASATPAASNPVQKETDKGTVKNTEESGITSTASNLVKRDDLTTYKNENCMCSPCIAESEFTPQKEQSVCSCSICSQIGSNSAINVNELKNNNHSCCCNLCDTGSVTKRPDILKSSGEPFMNNQDSKHRPDDICNCSICSKMSNNKNYCYCNYDMFESQTRFGSGGPTAPNNSMSLKSLDLFYMKNIHDLATREKTLLNNINDLEKRAKIYDEVFKEYQGIDFFPKAEKTSSAVTSDPEQKANAELKLENFLLKNELKEMRLEVRQYIERMDGPMQYKIESERFKNKQLEQKLEQAAKDLMDTQEVYEKELNAVKMQLYTANNNVYNLTKSSQKLNEEVELYKAKCAQLEEDLIRQKISEAESLKKLQAALKAQTVQPAVQSAIVKDECDLHQIARELSSILKECEPCGDCLNLPEDLTTAAKLLKSLTDMIDQKIPSESDKTYYEDKVTAVTKNVDVQKVEIEERCSAVCDNECAIDTPVNVEVPKDIAVSPDAALPVQELSTPQAVVSDQLNQDDQKSETFKSEHLSAKQSETAKSGRSEKGSLVSKHSELEKKVSVEAKQSESGKSAGAGGSIGVKQSEKSAAGSIGVKQSEKSAAGSIGVKQSERSAAGSIGVKQSEKSAAGSIGVKQSERSAAGSIGVKQSEKSAAGSISAKQSEAQKSKKSQSGSIEIEQKVTDSLCQCRVCPALETEPQVVETAKVTSEQDPKPKKSCKCVEFKKDVIEKTSESSSGKKKCTCSKKESEIKEFVPAAYVVPGSAKTPCKCDQQLLLESKRPPPVTEIVKASAPSSPDGVDQIWPKDNEKLKLTHQMTASRSKDLVKSQTSIKHVKVPENFPFNVQTHVDVVDKQPDGVHVTTTITDSGVLEVVTEGPEGHIETTLVYTLSGNVEVVTEITEYETSRSKTCTRGTLRAGSKAIEGSKGKQCLKALPAPQDSTQQDSTQQGVPPKSSLLNPNCQCRTCPSLLPEMEIPAKESTVRGDRPLDSNCQCAPCPSKTSEAQISAKESTGQRDSPQSDRPLDPGCQCVSCPSEAEIQTPMENIVQSDSPESSPSATGSETKAGSPVDPNCRCSTCPSVQDQTTADSPGEEENTTEKTKISGSCSCKNCPQ